MKKYRFKRKEVSNEDLISLPDNACNIKVTTLNDKNYIRTFVTWLETPISTLNTKAWPLKDTK